MAQIHLTKEYERDTSLVIECLWARTLPFSMVNYFGIEVPLRPCILFYTKPESVEIWENTEAIQWYRDRLLEENRKGDTFIRSVVSEYKPLLSEVEGYWKAGATKDIQSLERYIKIVEKAMPLFSLWYYSGSDERTPQGIKDLLHEMREKDGFFSYNDVFVKGCVKLLGGNVELANLLLPSEFPHLPDAAVLEKRAAGTVSVDGSDGVIMSLEIFAKQHPECILEGLGESLASVHEVRGSIAYKGKVTGRVRIVKNKAHMREVQEGDILISPMTTPDFLPAMQKAAAFVTDEGGIICHAAIVAREMKKPCIIGTKIATKIFKDGDLIEVDANKGIITSLN